MKTFLTLLLVIIVLPLLSACATPSQIMADAEVRRLCEKDGGIKVYETVKLPAERFDEYGRISIAKKENMKSTDKFYFQNLVLGPYIPFSLPPSPFLISLPPPSTHSSATDTQF